MAFETSNPNLREFLRRKGIPETGWRLSSLEEPEVYMFSETVALRACLAEWNSEPFPVVRPQGTKKRKPGRATLAELVGGWFEVRGAA